jgi:hypothetical protein
MKKKALFLVLALWMSWIGCYADEGMWIPMLLKKYNIEDMQKEGFKLTAEDIYDINKASLKDAVIGLGREGQPFFHFCTGEIISLGPSLPAFVSPTVLNVLVDKFKIKPVTTPEEDLKAILG